MIDTHAHLDGPEYTADLDTVLARARAAGVDRICLPAIDLASSRRILRLAEQHEGRLFPMIGLHPEEVKEDWEAQADQIECLLCEDQSGPRRVIAIGEVGLDYYWSRQYEREQILALERQVGWAARYRLPLMIHCRKAQNEMLAVLAKYRDQLCGGVFHCFTGNRQEARQLLAYDGFCLGIGGVATFKSSHLREDLPAAVPLQRIVLETDSPYMAPVPHRGERNESAYVALVAQTLATSYGVTADEVARLTSQSAERVFPALRRTP